MAAVLLYHPHYQLTSSQVEKEQALLVQENSRTRSQMLDVIIKANQWDLTRAAMCSGMDALSFNIMGAWASPEAHEQLVYQLLILSLRTDNIMGALLLHQLAMAHHQRGWDWRPSPDEFHNIAEISARYLVEKRYNVISMLK